MGETGVLFEQNQDNRRIGLIYCKEYLGDYFANRETLRTISMPGLTQGIADLWSNRPDKLQTRWLASKPMSCLALGMRGAVPRFLKILRNVLGDEKYQRLRARWHALKGQ